MTLPEVAQQDIREAAERICSSAFGGAVQLGLPQAVRDWDGRSWTRRFALADGPSAAPASVIAKHFLLGEGHGFDEWAGLVLVGSGGDGRSPVPELYGGDVDLALIVIEDLGEARENGLNTILQGDDPVRAASMLTELMKSLAQIHATSSGNEREYGRLRVSLPPRTGSNLHAVHRLDELLHQFSENVQTVGYAVSQPAGAELDIAAAELREPGPFLGFSHGDVCPSNAIQQGERVRLYDLEVSGYRHILLDGVYPQLRYLCCQEAGRIPAVIQRQMSETYRARLGNSFSVVHDDDAYGRGLLVTGAAWLAALVARIPAIVAKDRRRLMGTDRQRVLQGLREFSLLATDYAHLPALNDMALDMQAHLETLWPGEEHQLSYFPAFLSAVNSD